MYPKFIERGEHEKGFAEIFAHRIAPGLEELENTRKNLLKALILWAGAGIGLTALLIVIYSQIPISTFKFEGGMILAIFALIIVGGICWHFFDEYDQETRDLILPPVCDYISNLDYKREPEDFDYERFYNAGIICLHDDAKIRDHFSGRYRDTAFQLVDARLDLYYDTRKVVVFHGMLMEINVPIFYDNNIVILRRANLILHFWRKMRLPEINNNLEEVNIGAKKEFRRHFTVYADDETIARKLVQPRIQDLMIWINETFPPKGMFKRRYSKADKVKFSKIRFRHVPQAAFQKGVFMIAIPVNRDLFAMPSLLRSAYSSTENIHTLLTEIMLAYYVVELMNDSTS